MVEPKAALLLLVDPSAEADALASRVVGAGFVVERATVADAIAVAHAHNPALIVVDADIEGALDLCDALRGDPRSMSVPLILVGEVGRTVRNAADATLRGADAFWARPIDVQRLATKAETYLSAPPEELRLRASPNEPASAGPASPSAPAVPSTTRPLAPPLAPPLPPPLPPNSARESLEGLAEDLADGWDGPPEAPGVEAPAEIEPTPTAEAPAEAAPAAGPAEAAGLADALEPEAAKGAGDDGGLADALEPETPASTPDGLRPLGTLDGAAPASLPERPRGARPEPTFVLPPESTPGASPPPAAESGSRASAEPAGDADAAASSDPQLSTELRQILSAVERRLFPHDPPLDFARTAAPEDLDTLIPADFEEELGPSIGEEPRASPASPTPSPSLQDESPMSRSAAGSAATLLPTQPRPVSAARDRRAPSTPPAAPAAGEPAAPVAQGVERLTLQLRGREGADGDLAKDDVALVLTAALGSRFCGRIDFARADAKKTVFLDAGRPVVVTSTVPDDRFIELLYREGRLSRAQYDGTRATISASGRRAGAILVERGILRPNELFPLVRHHYEEVLYSVFAWRDGRWELHAGEPPSDERIHLDLPAAALIAEGVRRKYTVDRLEELLGGPSTVLKRRPAGIALLEDVQLLEEERLALEQVDGRRPLLEVLGQDTGATDLLGGIYALFVLGWLEIVERGQTTTSPAIAQSDEVQFEAERSRLRLKHEQVRSADYFTMLGVERTASAHEIRAAYTRMRKEWDPGRIAALSPTGAARPEALADMRRMVDEIAAALDEAHEVLKDGRLRESYRSHLP